MRSIGFHASLEEVRERKFVVDERTIERINFTIHNKDNDEFTEQEKINLLIDSVEDLKEKYWIEKTYAEEIEKKFNDLKDEYKSLFAESRSTQSSMLFYCHLSKLLGFFLAVVVFLLSTMILNH